MAILPREEMARRAARGTDATTRFRGFDLADRHYESEVFECRACPNLCEVRKIVIEGEAPVFYGARCDKFEEAAREALQRARATLDWSEVMKRSLFGNDADTLVEGQLRCMIHSGAAGEAVPLLKQELEHAEAAKRQRRALRLRILLALALTRTSDSAEIKRMFGAY